MTANAYSGEVVLGYRCRACFSAESVFGVPVPPSAAGCRVASLNLTCTDEELTRDDKRDTRSPEPRVKGKRSVEVALNLTNCPSGLAGSPPDFAPLLRTVFAQDVQGEEPVFVASPAPGVSGGTVADAAGLAAGDVRGIALADGLVYAVVLTAVDGCALTWQPPLPAAPAAGAQLTKAVRFGLQQNPQNAVTLYKSLGDYGECAPGCVLDNWTFSFDASDFGRLAVAGKAKDWAWMKSGMTLATGGIDAAQTALPLAGEIDGDIADAGCFYLRIVDATHGDEIVQVSAVAPEAAPPSLTVTRGCLGTSAVAHDAGCVLELYWPEMTAAGAPVPGVAGRCVIDDLAVEIVSAEVKIDDCAKLRNGMFGARTAKGRFNPAARAVTFALSAVLKRGELPASRLTRSTPRRLLLQLGHTAGSICVLYLKSVQFDVPAVAAGDDDEEIELPLSGVAVASLTDREAELVLAYL